MVGQKNEQELCEAVWFEPIRAFLRRKCNDKWTQRHVAYALPWVINAAITQESFHTFGYVLNNRVCTHFEVGIM